MRILKITASRLVLAAFAAAVAVAPASAGELWDPHLRGVDEGLAAGALPPEGVYGVLNNYWAAYDQYDYNAKQTGVKLDALVEVPIVLWSTGDKVLGADYAVAFAEPFDFTNVRAASVSALSDNGHWGTYNTVLVPAILSWNLGNDWHAKGAFTIYADDASTSPAHPPVYGGVGSGNGFWTFEPDLGVSWLHDGWNVSLGASYSINTTDTKTHYHTGGELAIDYTATKSVGKWILGIGAHSENQLTADSGAGAAGCAARNGCKVSNYGIGPLVGYSFGGLELMAEINQNLHTENDVAGTIFNLRMVAPF